MLGNWILIEPCKAEQTSPNQIFGHVVAVAPRPGVLRSRARHRENGPQHDDPWSREVTKQGLGEHCRVQNVQFESIISLLLRM